MRKSAFLTVYSNVQRLPRSACADVSLMEYTVRMISHISSTLGLQIIAKAKHLQPRSGEAVLGCNNLAAKGAN